ncbi:GerAB/ArcD/ProY family transporter [Lihuaxuella thermophila]|uniref:Spore germination protein KB n=1 Tax=Lihuaxuella thermophila TaxID=1173111 RepID=A0A1H8EXE4_9BACL|nr:GerAB/ArcD/ProY family transporter [Lihuaxuella thermophila]SEN23557.1 spore germination protein KB [Lihuaxuella thermophila]
MLEKGKISIRQFSILACLCTIGSSALLIPAILVSEAKQDAWLAGILGLGIGLLLTRLYSALGARFPHMTFVQYSEKLLGKWIGKTFSLLFVFAVPFILTAFMLRDIADFITTQIMPETPIIAIELLTLSIFVLAARIGIQPIARASEIFFPG